MKKFCAIMSAFLLSGCIFQPAESENEAFLPLCEQYRRCGIRQARLRVRDGSALAAGKEQASYKTATICLAFLKAEDSPVTDTAQDVSSRIMQSSVGTRYYRALCKQPSWQQTADCGWQKTTRWNFTPHDLSYIDN